LWGGFFADLFDLCFSFSVHATLALQRGWGGMEAMGYRYSPNLKGLFSFGGGQPARRILEWMLNLIPGTGISMASTKPNVLPPRITPGHSWSSQGPEQGKPNLGGRVRCGFHSKRWTGGFGRQRESSMTQGR
jgi:hypothetical protein